MRNEFKIIYIDVPVEVRIERLKKRYVSKFDDDNERRIQADENDFKSFTDWDLTVKNENEIISLIIKNKNYEENYYNANCIAFICMC